MKRKKERQRENETELNYVFKANHLGIVVKRSLCYFFMKRKKERQKERQKDRQKDRETERE